MTAAGSLIGLQGDIEGLTKFGNRSRRRGQLDFGLGMATIKVSVWAGIVVGFLGVVMVLRPGDDAFAPATLLPIMAALLYALVMMATRGYCQRASLDAGIGIELGFSGGR